MLVSIDNGGTLTDICATRDNQVIHVKTLTTPHDLTECFLQGLRLLSERIYGEDDLERLVSEVSYIRYSTTQGTNAIVQRRGPRLGVLTNDAAAITAAGSAAPDLYSAFVDTRVREVSGSEGAVDKSALVEAVSNLVSQGANRIVVAMTGDAAEELERDARQVLYEAFPRHLLGAVPLMFACELAPMAAADKRIWAALFNAFLHPAMEQFLYGAETRLRDLRAQNPLLIFRNDGGATRVAKTVALKTYSSGPQGGVVGAEELLSHFDISNAVSIDIGGTTTDIAAFNAGRADALAEGAIEGVPVPIALSEIDSVGVGGGSIIRATEDGITVGPDSVGAAPGPACFDRGGDVATITDALLLEGLLDPDSYFGGSLKLSVDKARQVIEESVAQPLGLELEAAVEAMIDAYDSSIAKAVAKKLTGSDDVLVAFGGAGPMSVCGVAQLAGVDRVVIPRFAAVFSAYGILFSDVEHTYTSPCLNQDLSATKAALLEQARRGMLLEGFELDGCDLTYTRVRTVEGEPERSDAVDGLSDGEWLELKVVRPIEKMQLAPLREEAAYTAQPSSERPRFAAVDGASSQSLPVYALEDLSPGATALGPCIVEEAFFTVRVRDGWAFNMTTNSDLILTRQV